MRIIKEGKIPGGIETTCNKCGTVFEYYNGETKYEDDSELEGLFNGYGWCVYVECPLCKYRHVIDSGFEEYEHFSIKEWFKNLFYASTGKE